MNWVTFVGEGRSGHTIVSAILGSHPHMRMGEEQKYISKFYRQGWTREQIIEHNLDSGLGKARKLLNFPNILTHEEPLLAIGDKCGWDAVMEYRKRGAASTLLTDFGAHMGMPVKTIVTLRHPLDNITNWVSSNKYKRIYGDDGLRFRRMIRRYKQFHDAAIPLLEDQDVFYLHNEELISDPHVVIGQLSDWIGLPRDQEWLDDCAARVFTKPNQCRGNIDWPEEYVSRVTDYIDSCPLLEYYR
jgi:hypothetical protein